jgi:hypothetical protein
MCTPAASPAALSCHGALHSTHVTPSWLRRFVSAHLAHKTKGKSGGRLRSVPGHVALSVPYEWYRAVKETKNNTTCAHLPRH